MANSIGVVAVPRRFEALRDAVGPSQLSHVLIEGQTDLSAIKKAHWMDLQLFAEAFGSELSRCAPKLSVNAS